MTAEDRLALSMHVHMRLLRTMRRNTDIDWLASNLDYMREIQRLCRSHGTAEMNAWANQLELAARSLIPVDRDPESPADDAPPLPPDSVAD